MAKEKNAVLLAADCAGAFSVANIASQEKRIHRSERERDENRRYTSSVKTSLRSLEAAVEAKDADAAESDLQDGVLADRQGRAAAAPTTATPAPARRPARRGFAPRL